MVVSFIEVPAGNLMPTDRKDTPNSPPTSLPGALGDSRSVQLQETIKAIRGNLFVFMTNRDLEATNNGSERALRPCAVYRKITNGFRSEWGAKFYADLRSVVETARRRAIRAIDAIRLTLRSQPLHCAA